MFWNQIRGWLEGSRILLMHPTLLNYELQLGSFNAMEISLQFQRQTLPCSKGCSEKDSRPPRGSGWLAAVQDAEMGDCPVGQLNSGVFVRRDRYEAMGTERHGDAHAAGFEDGGRARGRRL